MKSKLLSVLIILAMSSSIIILTIVLLYSFAFWSHLNIIAPDKLPDKAYLAGNLIAIVAGYMFFLEFFIRTLGESIREMKNGKK